MGAEWVPHAMLRHIISYSGREASVALRETEMRRNKKNETLIFAEVE